MFCFYDWWVIFQVFYLKSIKQTILTLGLKNVYKRSLDLSQRMLDSMQTQKYDDIGIIIKWCLDKDKGYQNQLYKKYSSLLLGIAMRYSKNMADAEDILQESFVNIFRHLNELKDINALFPWMKKIVINTVLRKFKSKIIFENIVDISNEVGDRQDIKNMTAEKIVDIIQSLPDGYRIILNLHAIDGYSHAEIAELLWISSSTSQSQYAKVKKELLNDNIESE